LTVDRAGVRLAGQALEVADGQTEVSVAMRPDDFELASEAGDNTFEATVRTVEFGGRDSLLFVSSALGDLYVRLPGALSPGAQVRLRIPAERALAYAEAA